MIKSKLALNTTFAAVSAVAVVVDYLATSGEYLKDLFNDPKIGAFIVGLVGAANVALHLYLKAQQAADAAEAVADPAPGEKQP